MNAYRQDAVAYAESQKEMQLVSERLGRLYKKFDADERLMADQIVGEWILSDDESIRFDAMDLIEDFKIVSATSALSLLADRLTTSKSPGAPFERKKIERILLELEK